MIKAETAALLVEESVWEELIWQGTSEQPVILVCEDWEAERFEAISSIKLVGIGKERGGYEPSGRLIAEQRRNADDYLTILTSGLFADQQLDFVYIGRRDEHGREHFNWRIINRSRGATADEAKKSLEHLWQNQRVAMQSVKTSYRFAPITDPDELRHDEEQAYWATTIMPHGVSIGGSYNQIGFTPASKPEGFKHKTVIVPYPTGRRKLSFDSALTSAVESPCPVKVVLSISPVKLSPDSIREVSRATKWLRNSEPKAVKYFQEVEGSLVDEDMFSGLMRNLEGWLRKPTGFKVNCAIYSRESLPESLLFAIGRELFQGQTITVEVKKCEGAKATQSAEQRVRSDASVLDLRELVNGCALLPPVFPGVAALSDIGFEHFHALPVPEMSETGILLGRANTGSRNVRFHPDDRSSHMYVLGATGTGKSTLLYNMIIQDIRNGEGIALIDPHGDLYQQVLESIPRDRVRDVALIDFSDFENTVAINFLECEGNYKRTQMGFVVNEMINIFDRLYDLERTGGPMFEQYMRNALLLAMDSHYPGATLMDIPWIFEDREYRQFLVGQCKNQFVVDFWTKQAERAVGESSLNSIGPYITSKLNQFTTNPLLRPVIGRARSTINFRRVMDDGQILLVNLSKGQLSELDARLLGMLITGKIFGSAMERTSLKPELRRRFYLYVDEFQNFVSDTVAHILSEARKFGLHLALANQNLGQLLQQNGRQQVLDAVLSNCGSTLLFRLGAIDAEKLQSYTAPELSSRDLQELPNHHVVARLMVKKKPSHPFIFDTFAKSLTPDSAGAKEVIRSSQDRYTVQTASVEEEILRRRNAHLADEASAI